MANNYDNEDGVWRTIGGRRVFIKKGQSLEEAMKESGKFSRVAKNQDLYKKLEEENKKVQVKEEKKTIHTASGDYTFEEMQERDKEVKDLFKANWNNEISAKELNDKLDKMQEDGRLSYGERASLQYDASREYDKELDNQTKTNPATGKPIHKLGQLNETDEKVDISKSNSKNYFDKHEAERLEIAKDIAKEVYGIKEDSPKLEEYAKGLLEPQDGYIPEKGETFYTNQKGSLEYSTKSLEEWRDRLKKTSEDNKPFTQENSQYGGTREYSADDVKRMKEFGTKPMKESYSGYGWEGVNYDSKLSTKDIAKKINDDIKQKYPDLKISRKTTYNTLDMNIMSSKKDMFITNEDIDKMNFSDLEQATRSNAFEWWAKDNVKDYSTNHSYSIEDVRKFAKEQLEITKGHETSPTKDSWYLSDYGKDVVGYIQKQMNSYNYDDSDGQIDYFDTNFYDNLQIGKWNQKYEVSKDNQITNALKNKAYQNYMKQHPNTTMTFEEFKNR